MARRTSEEVSERMEDYLEALHLLSKRGSCRHVRISELSEYLKVSKPTALEMVRKLADRGLVEYERGLVKLTEEGRKIGEEVWNRHREIASFLRFLGVDPEIAERDACAIEHSLHPQSFRRLRKLFHLLRKATDDPTVREILDEVRGGGEDSGGRHRSQDAEGRAQEAPVARQDQDPAG
ncbi:metal-dependent transcriptional regulator [Methanopyrus sp.]